MDGSLEIEGSGEGGGRVREKIGILADLGWSGLPNIVLMCQGGLGIRNDDFIVWLNAYSHWHDPNRMPFPSAKLIADRMGVKVRTVQRSLNRLKKDGFILRLKSKHRGRPDRYDVRPLLKKLEPYAKELAKPVMERSLENPPESLMDVLADHVLQKTAA